MQENPLALGLGLPREPPPLSVVIFGASGDLTHKKLVPALFSLYSKGIATKMKIVGFARREWTDEQFRAVVRAMLDIPEFSRASADLKDAFVRSVCYVKSSFDSAEGYAALKERTTVPPNRLLYLAVPPDSYGTILGRIRESGVADQSKGFSRIIVEKPFGRDLQSARALNAMIASAFPENQIYRIDHYLGKETVQNVMLARFGNEIYEPVWNNRFVDHVQITMAETIGVETRGRYYESAGALRDMVQNHMMQLLCLVAMEPPVDQSPDSIRTEKVKVLKSLRPIRGAAVAAETVRAQYIRGMVDGADVPAYREEDGVAEGSAVETYAALRVHLDSWRWAGVPFYLRTGKRLSRRTTEISIHFKRPPLSLFGGGGASSSGGGAAGGGNAGKLSGRPPNVLMFRIQPHEGMTMSFNAKVPGYTTELRPVNMDFFYGSTFGEELPEAYERLLLDAMAGDSTLYMREDEVDSAWRFITDILEGWQEAGAGRADTGGRGAAGGLADTGKRGAESRAPGAAETGSSARGTPGPALSFYPAGSTGPKEAVRLLDGEDRKWRRL